MSNNNARTRDDDYEKGTYRCPSCGGEFGEPIPVRNQYGIESHHCPFCDEKMSARFTQRKNIENCVHTPTVDGTGEVAEVCSDCGAKMSLHGKIIGVKEVWNAQGGKI